MNEIDAIIGELRIPGLPYPMGQEADKECWQDILCRGWTEQADSAVVDVLKATDATWTIRQVNAAYLADRIMDVFLRRSGLHISLVRRVARLRYYLAWQLDLNGEASISRARPLRQWLDHLIKFRGWSDDQGRSSRRLVNRLDALIPVISQAFNNDSADADAHFLAWLATDEALEQKAGRLRTRLLETETGASRQRAAEMSSASRITKTLAGRSLPGDIIALIDGPWQALLRQIALLHGIESDYWKQATRSLDWAVWALDPGLSAEDRNRLYQVAEELPARLAALWLAVFSEALPVAVAESLQKHLIARMRGEQTDLISTGQRQADPYWLELPQMPEEVGRHLGRWMVFGEGESEQRRWLFAYLDATGEVLWLNSEGVKQGLDQAGLVATAIAESKQRALPDPLPFKAVLEMTTMALTRVLDAQNKQRQVAAERAREEAAVLRRKRKEAQLQAEEEARRQAQAASEALIAAQENERLENEARDAAIAIEREDRYQSLIAQIDALHLGAWIELTKAGEQTRLKLAVKMNATGKLVFVDRLGLNQRVIYRTDLAEMMTDGSVRILDKGAEFDDTLSRVVGRIRVGR